MPKLNITKLERIQRMGQAMEHHDDRIDTSAIDNARSAEDIDPGGGRGAAMALLIVIIAASIAVIYIVKSLL